MKLTVGQIHDIVAGLSTLEDNDIKLSGETILAVAINLNAMRYIASGYEQARTRLLSHIVKAQAAGPANTQELEADFAEKDNKLRNKMETVEVRTLALKDLDLSNNPKIRPAAVARIMPILTGVS